MKLGGDFWCAIVVADFALLFALWFCCFLFDAAIAAVEGGGYLFFFSLVPKARIHTRVSVTCCLLKQKQQQQLL